MLGPIVFCTVYFLLDAIIYIRNNMCTHCPTGEGGGTGSTTDKDKDKETILGNLDASAVVNSMYPFSSTSKLWDIPKSTQFRSWIMTQPLMQLFRSQLLLIRTYIHTYTLLGLRYHRLVMNQSRSTVRLTDQGCLQYLLMDPIRITSLWECRDSNMACRRKAWSW